MIKNNSGQIIEITSQSSKLSPAFKTSYLGSKATFIGIIDLLRPYGLLVRNIMPGYIKKNLLKMFGR